MCYIMNTIWENLIDIVDQQLMTRSYFLKQNVKISSN